MSTYRLTGVLIGPAPTYPLESTIEVDSPTLWDTPKYMERLFDGVLPNSLTVMPTGYGFHCEKVDDA